MVTNAPLQFVCGVGLFVYINDESKGERYEKSGTIHIGR